MNSKEQETLGMLVGKTNRSLSNRLTHEFCKAGLGITKEQFVILNIVHKNHGITQQIIAETFAKDKTGVARIVEHLEKSSLLVRVTDQNDKRMKRIYLTNMGIELKEKAKLIADDILKNITENIDNNELNICKKTLEKLLFNLNSRCCNEIQN